MIELRGLVELRRPARLVDLAEMNRNLPSEKCLAGDGARVIGPAALAAATIAATRSWGAYEGELCLACGGLYEREPGLLEAWFACRPEAGSRIVPLVWAIRLTLRTIAETEIVEIQARVARGWQPGRRLSRLLGFRYCCAAGGHEIWRRPL